MHTILNSIDSRQLSFIEVLFYADDWLTLGTIAEKLKCSEKILRSDITFINNFFSPFQINTSVKRGVRISYPESYTVDYIYATILNNSTEFNFLKILFFSEDLKKVEIEEYLFTSPSSLSRIIKKFNHFFSQFNISIETSPYGIVGNEIEIQRFYVQYFLEKYLVDASPFDKEQYLIIQSILKLFFEYYELEVDLPELNEWVLTILVALIRFKNGYESSSVEWQMSEKQQGFIHKLINSEKLTTEFQNYFKFPLAEDVITQVFKRFFSDDLIWSKKLVESDFKNAKKQQYFTEIHVFLDSLSRKLSIQIEETEPLIIGLHNSRNLLFQQNYVLYDRKSEFVRYINQEYPSLIRILKEEVSHASFFKNVKTNNYVFNEIVYILIINCPKLTEDFSKYWAPISVGVISEKQHANFICNLVEYHFERHVLVSNLSSAPNDSWSQYDLIILTSSFLHQPQFDTPVISVSSVPSNREWKNIQHKIFELSNHDNSVAVKRF